jgi:UDP-2,4-diacetamido-2,4,6-trideoxy-beta-L-altropyranose hydrolase
MANHLIIRADASVRTGTGHVMRCLALAQAWRRSGGSAIFASAEITAALKARLANEGFQCVHLAVMPGSNDDSAITGELAKSHNAEWIVADGYQFGLAYQRGIKDAGLRLLMLDDYGHAEEYVADLVLNQNLAADPTLYARRAPHTRLLLGTRYALLREEFLSWRDWQRGIPAVGRKVLVSLGGSDPDNVTANVIQALAGSEDLEIVVVVGGSNPHLETLQSKIQIPRSRISLVVDATNMPELMAWADVAIAAGGSTSWELAFMGLPSLVLTIADNQIAISTALESRGLSITLASPNQQSSRSLSPAIQAILSNHEQRSCMNTLGRHLVDGCGSGRVVQLMQDQSAYQTEK